MTLNQESFVKLEKNNAFKYRNNFIICFQNNISKHLNFNFVSTIIISRLMMKLENKLKSDAAL